MREALGTVRVRTTLLAVLVVAAALSAGAVGLVVTLERSLARGGDEVAQTTLRNLAMLASSGAMPSELAAPNEDEQIEQVVDAAGTVVAASRSVGPATRLATFIPAGDGPVVRTVRGVLIAREPGDYRVWAQRSRTPRGPVVVYFGTNLESVSEALNAVQLRLVLGLPALLVILAGCVWFLLGRTLRPVEAIRAEVADISERALDRRVPVPSTRDEIGRLAQTMNGMLDRLQAADQRQRAFVGDASHELQSPLSLFRAELEVALAHPATADWPASGATLLAGSRRMERLVRDLLFLARHDEAGGSRPTGPVDLDDVVLEEATRLAAGSRRRIDVGAVSAAPVHGSRDELTRLTRNLLENAERHAATTVRVELVAEQRGVRLTVDDDGPGVPREQRERVFERFARLDPARSSIGGGTGLGLAIVKAIAERHGGTVSIQDSPLDGGHGARLVVRLPQLPTVPASPDVSDKRPAQE